MLTAVWTILGILKIIGFVLLGILGLLLFVLLLVLLVPVRYQAQVSFDGRPKGQAGLSWLCHLLWVRAVYEEKLTLWVRVLGIRVFRLEKSFGKAGEENPEEQEASKRGGEERPEGEGLEGKTGTEEGGEKTEENIKESLSGREIPEEQPEESSSEKEKTKDRLSDESPAPNPKKEESGPKKEKKGRKKKKRKKKPGFSFRRIYDKLKEKLGRIRRRLAELEEKEERLIAFVKDPANQRTYRLLKRQLWKLVKHIGPRRISGRVRFGFDDPAKTGQILAYISPFYALYAKRLEVIPVFEEAVLEGEGKLRGRIRIGTLIGIGVRVLLDKNFRALLKKLLRA